MRRCLRILDKRNFSVSLRVVSAASTRLIDIHKTTRIWSGNQRLKKSKSRTARTERVRKN